eukprot:s2271_g9.t1
MCLIKLAKVGEKGPRLALWCVQLCSLPLCAWQTLLLLLLLWMPASLPVKEYLHPSLLCLKKSLERRSHWYQKDTVFEATAGLQPRKCWSFQCRPCFGHRCW